MRDREAAMCERIDELKEENAKLRDHLESLVDSLTVLIQESSGVSGLRRNGGLATWGELTEGGRFEDWLVAYNDAVRLIAALEAK